LQEFTLLLAQLLEPQKLLLEFAPVPQQFPLAKQFESQLSRRHACTQLVGLRGTVLTPPQVHLFDQALHSRYLLIRGSQSQLLLVFETLAEMQYRLQREMESHLFRSLFSEACFSAACFSGARFSPAAPSTY
jgi:hypothetical protein